MLNQLKSDIQSEHVKSLKLNKALHKAAISYLMLHIQPSFYNNHYKNKDL